MATWRVMAYIVHAAVRPGEVITSYGTSHDRGRALNALAHFEADMLALSHGECVIDLSFRALAEVIPDTCYFSYLGQEIPHAPLIAQHCGEFDQYDAFMVYAPASLVIGTGYRGLGGVTGSTPWGWCKIGSAERWIMPHELGGHAIASYLRVTTAEFTNFPSCGGDPPIHCNANYGFASDIRPAWLEGFLSGTLADGKGISAAGWAVQTPTQRGAKVMPGSIVRASPWGDALPMRLNP